MRCSSRPLLAHPSACRRAGQREGRCPSRAGQNSGPPASARRHFDLDDRSAGSSSPPPRWPTLGGGRKAVLARLDASEHHKSDMAHHLPSLSTLHRTGCRSSSPRSMHASPGPVAAPCQSCTCHCRCRLLTCLSRVLCPSPWQPRRCGGWRAALGRRHLHRATLLASGARPRLHLLYVASAAARRRAAERAALGRAVLFASRAPRGVGLPRPASRGARQGAPRASNSPFPRTPARVAHFCSFSRD